MRQNNMRNVRSKENVLKRIINESVKKVLNENQYEKGYNSGQFLIKTRIERYGEIEGRKKLEDLYYVMLKNTQGSRHSGLKPNPFILGEIGAIEEYLEETDR